MQKVVRTYVDKIRSLDELQKVLDEGYVVVMATKIKDWNDAIEYILEKKNKEVSIETIVKSLRGYAKRISGNDQDKWIKEGMLHAAMLIEVGEIR